MTRDKWSKPLTGLVLLILWVLAGWADYIWLTYQWQKQWWVEPIVLSEPTSSTIDSVSQSNQPVFMDPDLSGVGSSIEPRPQPATLPMDWQKQTATTDEAQSSVRPAVKSVPLSLSERSHLGYKAFQAADFVLAIEHYQQALRVQPNHLFLRQSLASAYWWQGEFKQAAQTYQILMNQAPNHPNYFAWKQSYHVAYLMENPLMGKEAK